MKTISTLTIEHIVIASNQPYEKVLEALKSRMGSIEDWKEMTRKLGSIDVTSTSWEEIVQIIETHLGTSGFTIFNTVEHTPLEAGQSLFERPKVPFLIAADIAESHRDRMVTDAVGFFGKTSIH